MSDPLGFDSVIQSVFGGAIKTPEQEHALGQIKLAGTMVSERLLSRATNFRSHVSGIYDGKQVTPGCTRCANANDKDPSLPGICPAGVDAKESDTMLKELAIRK